MPLNMSAGGSGDFTAYIKFNAKAGRFYVKNPNDINGGEIEITNPRLAIDFDNIKTGWIMYADGSPPQKVWDVNGIRQPQPPAVGLAKWKEGFEVIVYGGDVIQALGDKLGLRELSSTSGSCKAGIIKAHQQYEAGRAANPGAVPVFVTTGVVPVKSKQATNYEPIFQLEKWVPRSLVPAFDAAAGKPSSTAPIASAAPPVAVASPAPALAPVAAPSPAAAPAGASAASEF